MCNYPILLLDRNQSKGTACSKKGYGCKGTCETIQNYTWAEITVKEQLVVRKDMDVKEHVRLSKITLGQKLQ